MQLESTIVCGPACVFGDGTSAAEIGSVWEESTVCSCTSLIQTRSESHQSTPMPKTVPTQGCSDRVLEGFVCGGCGMTSLIGFEGCFEFEGIRCHDCWKTATAERAYEFAQTMWDMLEMCSGLEAEKRPSGESETVDSGVCEDCTGDAELLSDFGMLSAEVNAEPLVRKKGRKRVAEEDDVERRRRKRSKRCKKRRIRRRD